MLAFKAFIWGGEVRDSVVGGKSGKVKEPMAAEGKFAGALNCDGGKGNMTRFFAIPVGLPIRSKSCC